MADATTPLEQASLYLDGLYASAMDEITAADMTVIGEIHRDLNGMFFQNDANPRFHPNAGHSWFDGDGMVRGVQLDDGRPVLRSRWMSLPHPRVQHDMTMSDRFICVFDFPLMMDFNPPQDWLGFVLNSDAPARRAGSRTASDA